MAYALYSFYFSKYVILVINAWVCGCLGVCLQILNTIIIYSICCVPPIWPLSKTKTKTKNCHSISLDHELSHVS